MRTLKEVLADAGARGVAVGHFNISDIAGFNAVTEAAEELKVPVIIGVSEGEREFVGVHEAVALVGVVRELKGVEIFLNADHTHSLARVEEAARAGFDAILFDGSKLPLDENIAQTKKAVELARLANPKIFMEGEIGYIGGTSAILKETPEGAALSPEAFTKPDEAERFVKETAVDALSPAVGNMHGLLEGMVKGTMKKRLDIGRIAEIKKATGVFLVQHGGSGTADEDFLSGIGAGINIIHVNTELRLAWRKGVEEGLAEEPGEIAPYKILPDAVRDIKEVVISRLKLFNKM